MLVWEEPGRARVAVACVKNVQNLDAIVAYCQQPAAPERPLHIFCNAALVAGKLHIAAATAAALRRIRNETMKSKSEAAELLCSLSPCKNMTEIFESFGVGPETKTIAIVVVLQDETADAEVEMNTFLKIFDGELIEPDEVLGKQNCFDLDKFKDVFKVTEDAELNLPGGCDLAAATRCALKHI